MDWWQGYVDVALLGTNRRSPTCPQETDNLSKLVCALNWNQPEAALLSAAGIVSQYQRVGKCAEQRVEKRVEQTDVAASTEPCQPDVQPCCSDRIAQYLGVAMQEYPEAMPELLGLMRAMDQRVPPKWLPKLLSFGQRRLEVQAQISAVLGNRGRWLAAQNPDWRYGCVVQNKNMQTKNMQTEDIEESEHKIVRLQQQWQLGEPRERCLALQQWRGIDPEAAREALCEGWKKESRRDREAFLSAIATGLSLEDEPFLEEALNDRASAVRKAAADLLAQLPESALTQRMTDRVCSFIRLYGEGQQMRIEVSLPEAFDKAWERDGIVLKPASGEGERAGWLRQMLAKTPLYVWSADPADIVKAAAVHEWREVLLNGWAQAIQRQRSGDCDERDYGESDAVTWAIAWLYGLSAYELDEAVVRDLLLLLPTDRREHYLRFRLPACANHQTTAHWLRLVAAMPQQWDFKFSKIVLTQLFELLKEKAKYGDLFSPPTSLALSLHPGLAAQAAQQVNNLTQDKYPTRAWQKFLDRFLGLLSLRWEIYQAYADSS